MLYKNVLCLIIGIIIGVRLTEIWEYLQVLNVNNNNKYNHNKNNNNYKEMQQQHYEEPTVESIILKNTTTRKTIELSKNLLETETLANYLYNRTRILCWILTSPQNHLKRALHVKRTWGKRCNRILFMSTRTDRFLNSIKLDVPEGREYLWQKTRAALKYIYEHHYEDADWFLKADDDTYIIMENLRAFLHPLSTTAPVYFGCKFHPFVQQGYMSGGAGYVLSKEALRRFAVESLVNTTLCANNNRSEDKELGVCLHNVGVVAGDARDADGRERFNALAPHHLIPFDASEWYKHYLFYKPHGACCSPEAISFHYIKPKDFYLLDYYLYTLRPFGVGAVQKLPSQRPNMSALLDKWRHEMSDNVHKTDD